MTLNHDFPDHNPVDDDVSNYNNDNIGENRYNDIVIMIIIVKMMIIMTTT